MATAKDVISIAEKYIGVKENPANSNKVMFNTHYYGSAVSGSWYPWCCTFVWDVFRMAGASSLFYNGEKVAYCPYVYNWAKKHGLIVAKGSGRYGDIVLFDWGGDGEADHIGLITGKNSDGSYNTIEGNTSYGNDSNGGEVMRRVRYVAQIQAIVRPKYAEEDEMTEAEVKQIVQNEIKSALQGVGSQPSDWAVKADTIKKAKKLGITVDGERPQGYMKREEGMQMNIGLYDTITDNIKAIVVDALSDIIHDFVLRVEDDGK